MPSKLDLSKVDLYSILGVNEDATEKEIVKSYRKQALKCHPDKNPDNPKAAEQFHQLAEALEILTDAAARAAYDKILKAKKAAEIRRKQYDSKRKKFKDDLEAREQAASQQKEDSVAAAKRLQEEIERLRKEGSRILAEAQEQLQKDLEEKLVTQETNSDNSDTEDTPSPKLKVKWKIQKGEKRDEGYTREEMMDLFSQYGEVLNIVLSVKKSGTAIIEFASTYSADLAAKNVTGKPDFPLTVSWLSGEPPADRVQPQQNTENQPHPDPVKVKQQPLFPSFSASVNDGNKDFESVVLMRMRQAEERKRLIEEMEKEDQGET